MKLVLTHMGRDSWARPVYRCGEQLYVDVCPREDWPPDICTKNRNEFDGEPLDSIAVGTEVEFVPARDTW